MPFLIFLKNKNKRNTFDIFIILFYDFKKIWKLLGQRTNKGSLRLQSIYWLKNERWKKKISLVIANLQILSFELRSLAFVFLVFQMLSACYRATKQQLWYAFLMKNKKIVKLVFVFGAKEKSISKTTVDHLHLVLLQLRTTL